MTFCAQCLAEQFCRRLATPVFVDDGIGREEFITDFRRFLVSYSFRERLLPSEWHEHVCSLYRDYRGWMKDKAGSEVFLDMDAFEVPHIREWFRDFIQPVPPGVQPRIRTEARERVRVLATIMRAHFPAEAMLWGMRAANDNEIGLSPSGQDCPR